MLEQVPGGTCDPLETPVLIWTVMFPVSSPAEEWLWQALSIYFTLDETSDGTSVDARS